MEFHSLLIRVHAWLFGLMIKVMMYGISFTVKKIWYYLENILNVFK